jgi:hypothetical protein
LASSDFFLFGYLKKQLQEIHFRSQNGTTSAVTAILSKISVHTLSEVFDHGSRDYTGARQMVGRMSK